MYACMCVGMCVYVCVHACMYVCMCVCWNSIICVKFCPNVYVLVRFIVHTHIHTHTHTRTHMLSFSLSWFTVFSYRFSSCSINNWWYSMGNKSRVCVCVVSGYNMGSASNHHFQYERASYKTGHFICSRYFSVSVC